MPRGTELKVAEEPDRGIGSLAAECQANELKKTTHQLSLTPFSSFFPCSFCRPCVFALLCARSYADHFSKAARLFMDSGLVRIFCANSPAQKARGASYNLLLLLRKDYLFCHRSECYGPPSPSISLESIKSLLENRK